MSGGLRVLLDNTYSLLEQVREDSNAIFLWDKHGDALLVVLLAKPRNTKGGKKDYACAMMVVDVRLAAAFVFTGRIDC
jgi:hypothetical protein